MGFTLLAKFELNCCALLHRSTHSRSKTAFVFVLYKSKVFADELVELRVVVAAFDYAFADRAYVRLLNERSFDLLMTEGFKCFR